MERTSGWKQGLFYLGLALLATHELDAVARHEWRLLPIFSMLPDDTGRLWFILVHIPLFAMLFWLSGHASPKVRLRSQLTLDIFFLLHGVIHFALSKHALYEFRAPVETITVYGAALVGLVHVVSLMQPGTRD